MRTKFKAWAEPYINEHPEVCIKLEDVSECSKPVYLEIGSGKGQFLVNMAKKFPDLFFIGVERNVTCSGFACKKLVEEDIQNAKLHFGEAGKFLEQVKDKSIERIFLNFSDPWPKKRHNKRRLTSDNFLKEYERVLSDDGYLIFKTDNFDLFEFSLETFANSGFELVSQTFDYAELEEFDTMTEYEENFRSKGQKICRLVAKKKIGAVNDK